MSFACTSGLLLLWLLTLKSCWMHNMDIWIDQWMKTWMEEHTGLQSVYLCFYHLTNNVFYILFYTHLKILIAIKDNTPLKQIIAFSEWPNSIIFPLYLCFLLKYTGQNWFRNYCICIITCLVLKLKLRIFESLFSFKYWAEPVFGLP